MSEIFRLDLNDTFSYTDFTIPYDAANVTYTANLSIGYFNETTGNYTFVPTTLNTTSHTVTGQVSDLLWTFGVFDKNKYQALPALAQTEMGYISINSSADNWTVTGTDVVNPHTTLYYNGLPFPPGNYTIDPGSGYYAHMLIPNPLGNDICPVENYAYQNYNGQGPYVNYTGPSGSITTKVSSLVIPGDSNHRLQFTHYGGPVGIYISGLGGTACAQSLIYTLYYGDGPALPDDLDYETELNNTAFNITDLLYQKAVIHYQAGAGCVLGQAGKKGAALDAMHSAIPGYSRVMNDEIAESTPYMFGHVVCSFVIPVPEIRDFLACGAQGDLLGTVLNALGTGYLSQARYLLRTGDFIPVLMAKTPGEAGAGFRIMNDLWKQKIYEVGLPATEKVGVLDKTFNGAATRLKGLGFSDEIIAGVYERGGNIDRTVKIGAKTDGNIVWLEEGFQRIQSGVPKGEGWVHIRLKHVTGEVPGGDLFPDSMTEDEIKILIFDSVEHGTPTPGLNGQVEYFYSVGDGRNMITVVNKQGKIITSHPLGNLGA